MLRFPFASLGPFDNHRQCPFSTGGGMKALLCVTVSLLTTVLLLSACAGTDRTSTTLPETTVPTTPESTTAPPQAADSVFKNGYIYTVDKDRTVAQAIAVKSDTIVYVGDDAGVAAWIGPQTKVTDLGGKLVLPGMVDSHAHAPAGVNAMFEVSLYGIGSVEECQQTIKDFMDSHPGLQGLRGMGWINAVFGPQGPTTEILDEVVPDIPAVLMSEDGHSVWVNTKALEMAGVTKDTPTPTGGVIEINADGTPSGTLRESAAALVEDVIPPYTVEQTVQGLQLATDLYHSYGTTMVYIPGAGETDIQALHDLDAAGQLSIRYPAAIMIDPDSDPSVVDAIVQSRDQEEGGNFWIAGGKLFTDGVLEGHTAYLEEPYADDPTSAGDPIWDPQKFNEVCAALDKAGLQIHVHSIGDAATREALDGFAYAFAQNGTSDSRPMVTHVQLVAPEDITRFAQLGAIAVPQPYWFVVDTYYDQAVDYIGQERADQQYPMKSFFDAGAKVASASDFPVTNPPDPMLAIELGITRTFPADQADFYVDADPTTALWPAEDVTVEQMIESFTINGAYSVHMEDQIGSLEVGKKADLAILDKNILEIDPKEIHTTKVLLTVFGGQEVYRSETYKD
jgi:predicted amidohydrolase YtcJ